MITAKKCTVVNVLKLKPRRCTISQLYFGKELYVFRTDLLSIIRSHNIVFTAVGIGHTSYVDCLLAKSGWNSVSLSVACRVLYQNKVEK